MGFEGMLSQNTAPRKFRENSLTVTTNAPGRALPLCARLPCSTEGCQTSHPTHAQSLHGLVPQNIPALWPALLKAQYPISTHALHAEVTQEPMGSAFALVSF